MHKAQTTLRWRGMLNSLRYILLRERLRRQVATDNVAVEGNGIQISGIENPSTNWFLFLKETKEEDLLRYCKRKNNHFISFELLWYIKGNCVDNTMYVLLSINRPNKMIN